MKLSKRERELFKKYLAKRTNDPNDKVEYFVAELLWEHSFVMGVRAGIKSQRGRK
jgi:hypothetical protein